MGMFDRENYIIDKEKKCIKIKMSQKWIERNGETGGHYEWEYENITKNGRFEAREPFFPTHWYIVGINKNGAHQIEIFNSPKLAKIKCEELNSILAAL